MQDEGNQVSDEKELFFKLNINHNLTESDTDNIYNKSSSEHQYQIEEMKSIGWRFDKIFSMTIYFYKTGELSSSPVEYQS